jgi:hypothetical protein
MKKILFVILLSISSVIHAKWILIDEYDNTQTYINAENITRKNNLVKAWVKYELKEPVKLNQYFYRSMRAYNEYDCVEKKMRALSVTIFRKNNLEDSLDSASGVNSWEYVAPETVGLIQLNFACKSK